MMGEGYGNWSGFGPNPTFIVDLIVAAKGSGFLLVPILGSALRVADRSEHRIFLAFGLYMFLQDWYLACLSLSLFIVFVIIIRITTILMDSFFFLAPRPLPRSPDSGPL